MAPSHTKRKQSSLLYGQGTVMGSAASGSCSAPGGVFGRSWPEPQRDGRKMRRKDKLTWVKHTLTPYFDGHLWRKYGQKVIKDAPYPRLYFRCSYREDRHCLASKQVQQVTHDDPPFFEVTYMYEHTCNVAPIPAPDVADDEVEPPAPTGGLVLRFGCSGGGGGHQHSKEQMQLRQQSPQQYCQQPVLPPSPLSMMSFDYSNSFKLHQQQPAFRSDVPPAAASWSLAFPIIESSSVPPSIEDEGDMFSTWDWDSLANCLDEDDDHLDFGNHEQFPGNMFSWETTHGSSLVHPGMGIETKGMIF